jgi:hypothetical protein
MPEPVARAARALDEAYQASLGSEDAGRGSDAGTGPDRPATAAPTPALTPFVDLIDDALTATCADQDYRTIGQLVRDVIADPANRAIVAGAVIEAGVFVHADAWDAPEVTDDEIAQLTVAYAAARDAFRSASKAANEAEPPVPDHDQKAVAERENRMMDRTATEWDAYTAAEHRLEERRDLQGRAAVYYEGEDRPDDAIPLYRTAGPGGGAT